MTALFLQWESLYLEKCLYIDTAHVCLRDGNPESYKITPFTSTHLQFPPRNPSDHLSCWEKIDRTQLMGIFDKYF